MDDGFRKILSGITVTPDETLEIRRLSSPFSFLSDEINNNVNSSRPFVNDFQNSRLTHELMNGDWEIDSISPLEPNSRPKHILHAFDRIILQGDGPWMLFDRECRSLGKGYLDGSDVFIDAESRLFFFSNSSGMLEAHNLADGNRIFSASLFFGHAYQRAFIARNGDRMVVVSIEREIDQDAEEKPENSTIEALKFNEPQKIDEDGILRSSQIVNKLIRKTLLLLSARYDETLVVATNDQICLLDSDLQIKTAINGEFKPFVMSLDNSGIIYLVLLDNGVPKLRAIKPDGERLFSVELPEEMLNISYPPIITYDHRVFLIKDNTMMVFAADGSCIWEYKSRGPIAGAVVTGDDQLLISDGSELGVFEQSGRYRTLYEFEDETLQTPPTIMEDGDLVVATNMKLYRLTIEPSKDR